MTRRWIRWALAYERAYRQEHRVEVAPSWLYAKTPWLAFRIWLSDQIQHGGNRLSWFVRPGETPPGFGGK
jgi:hypothetical protein